MFFSHLCRGIITSRPQPLQRILKSIPERSTVNSRQPQGWGFFMRSTSPTRTSRAGASSLPQLVLYYTPLP